MPRDPHPEVDEIDRRLLDELQSDGRATVAHLARVVNLSSSATADRVRRLTDIGVITGYSVTVDTEALGYTVSAFVRLAYPSGNYGPFDALVASTPEIIEAHHVTGDDCFIIKVLARSMRDLERVTGRLATLGSITTNVVYSSPLPSRRITPA
ncbi:MULTISPECIES: Lrp/AsnC family transcriptional regulator [unclassified Rhodococcus (in: high G+C Gram-positive bacteria)]|uniref:Lrp/AsnC family transcriptional regulator n=1 Tax=unclassified Rhodococcus (in: high G+C Gram-positive bacteria) TaxID=192944 RepID=UPI0006FD26AE|nr:MULTISPECIES: Lrp/AsnC family transcriptional regulator [unclassified Rhodococcus (in: high G+C Gram-positive bacteria)]KQU36062.1 ArsR family transcriptional regulator [Rhodococcus sp. Leaf225]KQU48610.1 ArsR family transcriptional regulator [Rhodococcus sp. Leaf258]